MELGDLLLAELQTIDAAVLIAAVGSVRGGAPDEDGNCVGAVGSVDENGWTIWLDFIWVTYDEKRPEPIEPLVHTLIAQFPYKRRFVISPFLRVLASVLATPVVMLLWRIQSSGGRDF